MPRVTVQVRDAAGNTATAAADYSLGQPVLGGYYLSGGADPTADMAGGNFRSLTQYRSFADGYIFPGYNRPWLVNLGRAGVQMNMVLELKHYGAPNHGPQSFTVDGVNYTVPAPSMTIQQRPGTTWPRAYGYGQVIKGQCDGLFARALSQYRTLGFGVNIQLASELDTDHEFGTTEDGKAYTWAESDARAVQAMNYILTWFKARTLPTGTTFSVGLGGFDRACFQRTHPESLMSRLDYLQWNAYAHQRQPHRAGPVSSHQGLGGGGSRPGGAVPTRDHRRVGGPGRRDPEPGGLDRHRAGGDRPAQRRARATDRADQLLQLRVGHPDAEGGRVNRAARGVRQAAVRLTGFRRLRAPGPPGLHRSALTEPFGVRVAQLGPAEVLGLRAADRADRVAVEQAVGHVEAEVPAGRDHRQRCPGRRRCAAGSAGCRCPRRQLPAQQVVAPGVLQQARRLGPADGRRCSAWSSPSTMVSMASPGCRDRGRRGTAPTASSCAGSVSAAQTVAGGCRRSRTKTSVRVVVGLGATSAGGLGRNGRGPFTAPDCRGVVRGRRGVGSRAAGTGRASRRRPAAGPGRGGRSVVGGRPAGDEAGVAKHPQVFGDGRLADPEPVDQLADAAFGVAAAGRGSGVGWARRGR